MILALVTLYPVLAALLSALTTGFLVFTGTSNLILAVLCVAFQSMVPTGSLNPWFRETHAFIQKTGLWDDLVRNCRLTFQYHEKERPSRALYLWHPHGLMSMAPMLHCVADKHSRLATLRVFHQMPIVRDLQAQVGAIPADQDILKKHLEVESVSVIPGGVQDMMQTKPGVIHIVPRTGVFKLALETGTPIVPVLTYGENELFPVIQNSQLRALNDWLQSRWKWIVPLPHLNGIRNWLQLAEAPLPPIHSYAGKPIAVETCPHPSPSQIQDLRSRQETELRALFAESAPKGVVLDFATQTPPTLKTDPRDATKEGSQLRGPRWTTGYLGNPSSKSGSPAKAPCPSRAPTEGAGTTKKPLQSERDSVHGVRVPSGTEWKARRDDPSFET